MNIEFLHSKNLVNYQEACRVMRLRQKEVIEGNAPSLIWFLEHEEVITAGRSAKQNQLLAEQGTTPVCEVERGGKYTYHNPGQQIVYFIVNLKELHDNKPDIKRFVRGLEQIIIDTLMHHGINAYANAENIGIWVEVNNVLHKIASIGLSVKRWVTMHGIAINVNNNLDGFSKIIPCGINNCKITSTSKILDRAININEFKSVLLQQVESVMGKKN